VFNVFFHLNSRKFLLYKRYTEITGWQTGGNEFNKSQAVYEKALYSAGRTKEKTSTEITI
jgi:hypothetical protein